MANILITFASMSGNTEGIADIIKEQLEQEQHEVEVKEMEELFPGDIDEYEGILVGSYTWGEGDLPFEAEEFYDELEESDLTGKKAAAFGSGDTAYPDFCEAVNTFEDQLKSSGAEVVQEGIKIELSPSSDDEIEQIKAFAKNFSEKILIKPKSFLN